MMLLQNFYEIEREKYEEKYRKKQNDDLWGLGFLWFYFFSPYMIVIV